MSDTEVRSLKRKLGCVATVLGVLALGALLQYAPVLSNKWEANTLIEDELAKVYGDSRRVTIIRSSDYSNYDGLFTTRGLFTGGHEEYWDFCLLVEAESENGITRTEAYSASGDRAYDEMNIQRVADFNECRARQAG